MKIFKDYIKMKHGRFILPRSKQTGKIITDIQEMRLSEERGDVITEMISTSDTKEFFTQGINEFFMTADPAVDVQWEQIFTTIPSTGAGELMPFRDPAVAGGGSHGVVFEEVGELGEIQFSTVESNEKFVKNVKFATAIGYSNEWFEDGRLGLVEMVTEDFRRAAGDKLAEIHYGLLLAAITSGASKKLTVAGTTLDDLITAVNATVAIMMRNKWAPDWILAAPEQEDIVKQMLHDVYRDRTVTDSAKRLQPIFSEHLTAGQVLIVNAKARLISTDRLQLTLDSFNDLLHDSRTLVGKFRRGALIGDGKVVRAIDGL